VDRDAVYSSTLKTEFVIFFETIIINQKAKETWEDLDLDGRINWPSEERNGPVGSYLDDDDDDPDIHLQDYIPHDGGSRHL
jgi:hypothetical protein